MFKSRSKISSYFISLSFLFIFLSLFKHSSRAQQGLTQYQKSKTASSPISKSFNTTNFSNATRIASQFELFNVSFYSSFDGYSALRLTQCKRNQIGSFWYYRALPLRYGFTTSFLFRVYQDSANKSVACKSCGARLTDTGDIQQTGADGFALVFMDVLGDSTTNTNFSTYLRYEPNFVAPGSKGSLSSAGLNLGYGGLNNSLAVEFDCWQNEEMLDPYRGHVSVVSKGSNANSPSHQGGFGSKDPPAFGSTEMYDAGAPDPLWDPSNRDVIYIYPNVTPPYNIAPITEVFDGRVHRVMVQLVENGTSSQDKKDRLDIYFDDMTTPRLSVSVNFAATLLLNRSRECLSFYGCYDSKIDYCVERLKGDIATSADSITDPDLTVMLVDNAKRWLEAQSNLRRYSELYDVIPNQDANELKGTGCNQCVGFERCMGYIGFTAATGYMYQNHDIVSWNFSTTAYTTPAKQFLVSVNV